MTREEAIKILKELPNSILGVVLPFDIDFDYTQALDMAIKALEQETVSKEVYDSEYFARKQAEYELWKIKEQQSCEDAVSRKEVNKLYDEYRPRLATHVSEFGDKLKALPPVTPTRKAEWNTLAFDLYICSKCHAKFTHRFNFCPTCGADMRESEGKE